MKTIITYLLVILFLNSRNSVHLLEPLSCKSLHKGRFYLYDKANAIKYIILRSDTLQKEINIKTGDTSIWKINWTDDCTFTCRYLSGIKHNSTQEMEYFKNSLLIFKINKIERNYYTYDAEIKYNSTSNTFSDTLWLKKK